MFATKLLIAAVTGFLGMRLYAFALSKVEPSTSLGMWLLLVGALWFGVLAGSASWEISSIWL